MENPRVRLGELLVRAGLITGRQLEEALAEQRRVGKRLGSLLAETGLVSETQVTQILSQQLSVPWVSLHHIDFSRELLDLVPVDAVERFCLIPIYVRRVRGLGDALYVAMDDPTNTQALAEVADRSGLHVRAMIAPPSDIRAAIHAYYGVGAPPAPKSAPSPVPAPHDPESDLATGVIARSEVEAAAEAKAKAAAAAAVDEAKGPPVAAPAAVEAPTAVAEAPAVRAKNEDLRSMAPAKRPAANTNVAVAVGAGAPPVAVAAPPRPSGDAASSSTVAKDGAERLRRAMGDAGKTKGKANPRRMVALTLLDGTTIKLPGKGKAGEGEGGEAAPPEVTLTAHDLVAALRAAGSGADASEVLGDNVRWERLVAALLSVLLKKHLISDWEFVEELTKQK